MKYGDVCILFDSHGSDAFVVENFERYRQAAEGICYIYCCHDSDLGHAPAVSGPLVSLSREQVFGVIDHRKGNDLVPGNPDLKMLAAARQLPDFKRFIRVEYDVLPVGDVRHSIECLAEIACNSDLAASFIAKYQPGSGWRWWDTVTPPASCEMDRRELEARLCRAFLPLSAFSKAFLDIYADYLGRGWTGHYEALLPTVAEMEDRSRINLAAPRYGMIYREAFSPRTPHPADVPKGARFVHKVADRQLAQAILNPAEGGRIALPNGFVGAAKPAFRPSVTKPRTAVPPQSLNGPVASALSATAEVRIWATKGPHFWAFLAGLLVKIRPRSILEIGTGRSTTFLADYAFRSRIRLVAVEGSEVWYRKVTNDLRFMNINHEYVHHVPVVETIPGQPPWYDLHAVQQLIGGIRFDLVFVDGPEGASRRSPSGQECIMAAAESARLIIVDDVQHRHNLLFFNKLAARFPDDGCFFYSYDRNILAIAASGFQQIVRSCFDFLELPYMTELSDKSTQGDEVGE